MLACYFSGVVANLTRREPPHQLLFPHQQLFHRFGRRIRLDPQLHFRSVPAKSGRARACPDNSAPLPKSVLCDSSNKISKNSRRSFSSKTAPTSDAWNGSSVILAIDQCRKNFFRLQPSVQLRTLQMLSQFPTKTFRLSPACESAAALPASPTAAPAPAALSTSLRRSLAALLNAARTTGSSSRNCCAIRVAHSDRKMLFGNFLHVRQQEIHRAQFAFAGRRYPSGLPAGSNSPRTAALPSPTFDTRPLRFSRIYKSGSAFLSPTGGSASTCTSKSCSSNAVNDRSVADQPCRVRVVIHDHSLREPPQQLNLRLRQRRAAARHHIADSRPRHRNRIHVTFH